VTRKILYPQKTIGLPNIGTDITSLWSKTGKHRTSSILCRNLGIKKNLFGQR
jgi:hypothetical protein